MEGVLVLDGKRIPVHSLTISVDNIVSPAPSAFDVRAIPDIAGEGTFTIRRGSVWSSFYGRRWKRQEHAEQRRVFAVGRRWNRRLINRAS